jgi:excinuclease ABC subunit B
MQDVIYVSATPGDYEVARSGCVVEQIIRPTGLLDPLIEVRPTKNQIDNLIKDIRARVAQNERVLVTTLTIKMSEDLTAYLKETGIKVTYLHSEIKSLERIELIRSLRLGIYDVIVGINLLREGLDLPEVSLICILDADKEGFLRSERALIQTIGRAARNENGKVIMYADKVTDSMRKAIEETYRRRDIQNQFNIDHNITPKTIIKDIRDSISISREIDLLAEEKGTRRIEELTKFEKRKLIESLEKEMKEAAKNLEFERAATLRDVIFEIKAGL